MKPITQKTRFGKISVHFELANGESANFSVWLNNLLKTQDLSAWQHDSKAFAAWVAEQAKSYFSHLEPVFTHE